MKPRRKFPLVAKLMALAASVATAMLVGEVVLTVLADRWTPEAMVKASCLRAGLPYDGRTKRQTVEDLRSQGVEAYPSIHSREFRVTKERIVVNGKPAIPLTGVSNVRTIMCNETGKPGEYFADEHGFNNPKGQYVADRVEIAAVGDSFVQGYCVACDETITACLRKSYSNVLNLGSGGNGPLSILATIAEYCEPLRPRKVVWFHYELNDLEDDLREEKESPLADYLQPHFRVGLLDQQAAIDLQLRKYVAEALAQPPIPLPPRRKGNSIVNALLLRETRGLLHRMFPRNDYSKPHELLPLFEQTLAAAKRRVEGFGGKLAFVYLPCWKHFNEQNYQYATKRRIEDIVRGAGIPYLDMATEFKATGDPKALFPFRRDGHYTPQGYELVADRLKKLLDRGDQGTAAVLRDSNLESHR